MIQVDDFHYNHMAFNNRFLDGVCEDFDWLIDLFDLDVTGRISNIVRDAVNSALNRPGNSTQLTTALEQMLASISVSGQVGESLGVDVDGDIADIILENGRINIPFDVRFSGMNSPFGRTYSPPISRLSYGDIDPVTGQDYDIAGSISIPSLNQLLLAHGDLFAERVIDQINLGRGSEPITARLLSLFIPSLREAPPQLRFAFKIRPTSPLMIVGPTASRNDSLDVSLDNVIVDLVALPARGGERSVLTLATDIRAAARIGFDNNNSNLELTFIGDPAGPTSTLLKNRVAAGEASLRLIQTLAGDLLGSLSGQLVSFPLPEVNGVGASVSAIGTQNGYVSLYLDLTGPNSRPDFVVGEIDLPDIVDRNAEFDARIRIENHGSGSATGGLWVGGALSQDQIFMNGDDTGLGQEFISFGGSSLEPGESLWVTLRMPVLQSFPPGEHTLFFLLDVPDQFGGTGFICESNELNNHAGAQVFTLDPDVQVISVVAPEDTVVAGIGPRAYLVTIRRPDYGVQTIQIPIQVDIGNPVVTSSGVVMVDLDRGEEKTVSIYAYTPGPTGGGPGSSFTYQVRACANLAVDANRSNDCAFTTVRVENPYWDLQTTLENTPSSANRGSSSSWRVRVTNRGNVPTPEDVCYVTGITLYSGASNWNFPICNPGCNRLFWVPAGLAPGESFVHTISNFGIPSSAAPRTQYIKADVNYTDNCTDDLLPGN